MLKGRKKRGKKRKYKIGKVKEITAPNFTMNPAELRDYIPFDDFTIRRVYWLDQVKGESKSNQHAHIDDENEIFAVVQGSFTILLDDDGKGKRRIKMNKNSIVWIPRMVWHTFQKMSKDCIIVALTSTNYDPERKGYIEDYKEFKKLVTKR